MARVPEQLAESSRSLAQSSQQFQATEAKLAAISVQLDPLRSSVQNMEPRLLRIDQRVDQIYGVLTDKQRK